MIDADDIMHGQPGAWLAPEPRNCSAVPVHIVFGIAPGGGGRSTHRIQLTSADAGWKYLGVLHEYPHLEVEDAGSTTATVGVLANTNPAFFVNARCEGARSKDPQKYQKDAEVLEAELARDATNTRNLFYCAQSWRDAGQLARALERYKEVSLHPGSWVQERYVACEEAITCLAALGGGASAGAGGAGVGAGGAKPPLPWDDIMALAWRAPWTPRAARWPSRSWSWGA